MQDVFIGKKNNSMCYFCHFHDMNEFYFFMRPLYDAYKMVAALNSNLYQCRTKNVLSIKNKKYLLIVYIADRL
jgi:hypothetical protein